MEHLHKLILQKNTGTPKQLSEQLGISRVSLYMMIDELKSLSLPVGYSRRFETYYYKITDLQTNFCGENMVDGFKMGLLTMLK